jgi:nitrogen fixation protein FixH
MTGTPDASRAPKGRTAGWWWPWFIAALLVATAGGQAIMLYAATHDPTFAIEPDYYAKAVAYDTTIMRGRENIRLGWRASGAMTASDGGASVRIAVIDSAGLPVTGARISAVAIHNLDGSHPIPVPLTEAGGGYVGRIDHAHRGLWEIRLDAVRGADHFTPSLRVDFTP